ncbi:galactose oxidase [Malassezia pachydermatis]|uniref:Galactose oxidase n=1 Tax=Malassezia pachydermatis TaxID=77020 RepID=A0A0M8MT42_9BASI|nr:galactose oxidase [Malassezia pachydermatis]KOS16217.1 galactose oxidase [Malassezia pachydermatis]
MGKAKSAGKAAAKAAKKAKQEKLAERRATKQQKKSSGKKDVNDMDSEDLDALLAQYRAEWEEQHATTEEHVGVIPSRRANATLTPCPLGNDLWLYGGEYFDGDKCMFYQDLFRYIPEKNEWRSYSSKIQPGPRSAHQIVASPVGGGQLWCFGGEFASTKQTNFHHYRDLWVYSIAERAWEKIETKVRPSARSGHRMAMWKHFIVLFGGFVDTGVRTTYLQDLWVFDTLEYKWKEIKQNDLRRPSARSGFSFLPTPDGIVLYGGYCKKYVKGQRAQGVALEDAWMLNMDEDISKIEWSKRRKIGYAPNPPRSGCTMALWANRNTGVLFGGVTDTEQDEESMESTFWNDLYGYQLPGNGRWISLNMRRPKKRGGAKSADGEDGQEQEDPSTTLPLTRYNTMLAVQRNTLYIYGGIFESGDREYTLDDFYTIDLSKMNKVLSPEEREVLERKLALRREATAFMGVSKEGKRTEEDILSTPEPGEVLKTFYARTKHYWAAKAYEEGHGESRGKQLRRDGFDLAEKRFNEYKPILEEIERIRRDAGLDDEEMSNTALRRPTGPGAESRHRR